MSASRHAIKYRTLAELESILDLASTCSPHLLWAYERQVERALRQLRLAVQNAQGLPARPRTDVVAVSVFDELIAAEQRVDRELRNVPWGRPGGADQTLADELVTTKGAAP